MAGLCVAFSCTAGCGQGLAGVWSLSTCSVHAPAPPQGPLGEPQSPVPVCLPTSVNLEGAVELRGGSWLLACEGFFLEALCVPRSHGGSCILCSKSRAFQGLSNASTPSIPWPPAPSPLRASGALCSPRCLDGLFLEFALDPALMERSPHSPFLLHLASALSPGAPAQPQPPGTPPLRSLPEAPHGRLSTPSGPLFAPMCRPRP